VIFALNDLALYLLKLGKYSARSLESHGLVRATPEAFDKMNKNGILFGDHVFYHCPSSLASWAIMYYTNGPMSHVAFALGDGQVFDATTRGIIAHPIRDYFDRRGRVKLVSPEGVRMSAERERELRAVLDAQIGKGFAWRGVIWFWILIVCGAHEDYRVRFTVDFLILFSAIIFAVWRIPVLAYESCGIAAIYLLAVVFNIVRRQGLVVAQPAMRSPNGLLRHAEAYIDSRAMRGPAIQSYFALNEAMVPDRTAEEFKITRLSAANCESLASQVRGLSAMPDLLDIHLPAARLAGYQLWLAIRDDKVLGVLGARDAWSITWGDHVLIQDLISQHSQLGLTATGQLLAHVFRDSESRSRRCICLEGFRPKTQPRSDGPPAIAAIEPQGGPQSGR
jgi:hypothetical protein